MDNTDIRLRILERLDQENKSTEEFIANEFLETLHTDLGTIQRAVIELLDDKYIKESRPSAVRKIETSKGKSSKRLLDGNDIPSIRLYITLKGKQYLAEQRDRYGRDSQSARIINALSNNEADSHLIESGLSNKGLLGFLDIDKSAETFGLEIFLLTFPKGLDYFYTLDKSSEKFEGLKPISQGTLGCARKTPSSNYLQLYRFFSDQHHCHLYLINPDFRALKPVYNKNESEDNPIFIKKNNFGGGLPLYLYSNSQINYFTPLKESDDSDSDNGEESFPPEYQRDLENRIKDNELDISRFTILKEETSSTVFLNESTSNFYVNFSDENGRYFTVRRNPFPKGESYILNNIVNWPSVIDRFQVWLNEIKALPSSSKTTKEEQKLNGEVTTGEFANAIVSRGVFSSMDISIGDSLEIEPALEIESLADEIVKIIKNLKPEPGNMTGIFAQWGRGKTRLMSEIWKRLSEKNSANDYSSIRYRLKNYLFGLIAQKLWPKNPVDKPQRKHQLGNYLFEWYCQKCWPSENIEYIQIKYQAWRYQDTPASWAYLYEQFSLVFLGKRDFKNFFKYQSRLFNLNVERDGWWNFSLAIISTCLVFFAAWLIIPHNEIYQKIIIVLIPSLGFLMLIIKNLRLDYLTRAVNLVKKYGSKTSFNESLGIQAEIQKELIHLVNAWVDSQKRKLVLFVDDLDRCNEEKVIEIIDALRIILDDERIKDKLLVITAIDERILRLAVLRKYEQSAKYFNESELGELAREYIDKLFIFSVKLGPLTENESQDFFENFTKNEIEISDDSHQESVENFLDTKQNIENVGSGSGTREREASSSLTSDSSELIGVQTRVEKINKFTKSEIELFKKNLQFINNSTPRKIRILYYRYLFAKNLLRVKHVNQDENPYWLCEPYHEIFIKLLILFSQQPTSYISEQRKKTVEDLEDRIDIKASTIKVKRSEYLDLLKIFELAIAY